MRRLVSVLVFALVAAGAAVAGWAEFVSWQASHRRLGGGGPTGGTEAVVVLGYRDRGPRANFVNRYRVRVGLRSLNPGAAASVLVLCGGTVAGDVPEAELMERYARERCGYTGEIRLDRSSTTTQENIEHAIPLIQDADVIKIVSHSPHAEVGREVLWELRPDLAARLVRADDYRFGEAPVLKVIAAVKATRYRRARRR